MNPVNSSSGAAIGSGDSLTIRDSGSPGAEPPYIPAHTVSSHGFGPSTTGQCPVLSRDCRNQDTPPVLNPEKSPVQLLPTQTPAEFLESVNTGAPFRKSAEELVHKIHSEKRDPGMPCMKATAETILDELNKFFELNKKYPCLTEEDIQALKRYQQQVQQLSETGYPYFESLKLSLLYPLVQGMFYQLLNKSWPESELNEQIRKAHLEVAQIQRDKVEKGLSLASFMNEPWELLFEDGNSEKYKKLSQLLFVSNNALMAEVFYIPILKKSSGFVFVPLFSDFTLEMLTRTSPTRVIPMGFTTSIYEMHDGIVMSSFDLAFHDLWHSNAQWKVEEDTLRKRVLVPDSLPYPGISGEAIDYYYQLKKRHPEVINQYCDFLLFTLVHEKVGSDLCCIYGPKDTLYYSLLNAYRYTKKQLRKGIYESDQWVKTPDTRDRELRKAFFTLYGFLESANTSIKDDGYHLCYMNTFLKACELKLDTSERENFWDIWRKSPTRELKVLACEIIKSGNGGLDDRLDALSPGYNEVWKQLFSLLNRPPGAPKTSNSHKEDEGFKGQP